MPRGVAAGECIFSAGRWEAVTYTCLLLATATSSDVSYSFSAPSINLTNQIEARPLKWLLLCGYYYFLR